MTEGLFTITSITFFVLLAYSVQQLSETYQGVNPMFNETAEKLNGRAAMIGFVAAVGSYLATGQVIPGVW